MKHNLKELIKIWVNASSGQKDGEMSHENAVKIDKYLWGLEAELREEHTRLTKPRTSLGGRRVADFIEKLLGVGADET